MKKKTRVLIVDDEDSICEMLQVLFEAEDADAEAVLNAEAALRKLVDGEIFDLLLVDKNLPGMSGVELIRQVRAADEDVSIIMMTGFASADSIIETLNLGVDAYIEKPFSSVFAVTKLADEILSRKKPKLVPAEHKPDPDATLRVVAAISMESQRAKITAALEGVRTNTAFVDTEAELLESAAEDDPDMVILDADAWQSGSPEVVKQIEEAAPFAAVIILSSGNLSNAILRKLIDLGVMGLFEWTKDAEWPGKLRDAAKKVLAGA